MTIQQLNLKRQGGPLYNVREHQDVLVEIYDRRGTDR